MELKDVIILVITVAMSTVVSELVRQRLEQNRQKNNCECGG